MRYHIYILIFVLVFSLGCAKNKKVSMLDKSFLANGIEQQHDPIGANYLAYSIKQGLRDKSALSSPVIITTFVDLNNLHESSVFGRVIAERLIYELHDRGFTISEIRKGRDIFIKKDVGEMILSRDIKDISGRSFAGSILAGTYVVTDDILIVNARLLDIRSQLVLSSSSYTLRMNNSLFKLVSGEPAF